MLSQPPSATSTLLEVRLLGRPEIVEDGQKPGIAPSAKARALLFYLAVEGRAFAREEMAEMFWGDNAADPYKSLRVDKVALKKLLGDRLADEKESLALRFEQGIAVDVRDYLELARRGGESLEQAAALYRGEFLEGFQPGTTSAEFEQWQRVWRERLRAQQFDLLARIARQEMAQQRWARALNRTLAALVLSPLDEEVNRLTLLCYGQMGDLAAARTHLAHFEALWRSEAVEEPPAHVAAVLAQIESGAALTATQPALDAIHWGIFQPTTLPRHHCVRPQLLAEIENALDEDADLCAIIALVGTGGAGKSTLAIHAAHALQNRFPDGVLWGNAANSSPAALIEGWSQSLGFDFSRLSDLESRAAAWRGALSRRKVLLVLDNVNAPDDLELLFPASAGAAVLLTTRDREAAVALNARELNVGEMDTPTRLLLLEKILGVQRIANERAAANRLGEMVQGLPLALEVLAKRLHYAPAERIGDLADRLARMEHKLDLLEHGRQNVRACIALSWEPLGIDLRTAFATAGIFEGRTFTRDALAHLLQVDRYRAGDLIVAMLQRSLLGVAEGNRYAQHALVADFALEQLVDRAPVTERMLDYYTALARDHRAEHSLLEDEWGMLQRTLGLLVERYRDAESLELVENLAGMWFTKGRFSDARQSHALAHPAALRTEEYDQVALHALEWARACIEQGDYDEALPLLEQAEDAARTGELPSLLASILIAHGRICVERYEFARALTVLGEARTVAKQSGSLESLAQAIYLEADIPWAREEYDRAYDLLGEALAMQKQTADVIGTIQTMRFLIDVCVKLGRFDEAVQFGADALAICDRVEDRCERSSVHYSLAFVYQRLPEPDRPRALEHVLRAREIFERMGDPVSVSRALYREGAIRLEGGDFAGARPPALQSAEMMRQQKNLFSLAYPLQTLGRAARGEGKIEEARRHFEEGLEIARSHDDHPLEGPFTDDLNDLDGLDDLGDLDDQAELDDLDEE